MSVSRGGNSWSKGPSTEGLVRTEKYLGAWGWGEGLKCMVSIERPRSNTLLF